MQYVELQLQREFCVWGAADEAAAAAAGIY